VNDPIYNSFAFGKAKGKNAEYGQTTDELIAALTKSHCSEQWIDDEQFALLPIETKSEAEILHEDLLKKEIGIKTPEFNPAKLNLDDTCDECKLKYINPEPKSLMIYLHALRYKGKDWDYKTEAPFWAKDDWTDT
jgi:hypothetical protein